MADTEDGLAVGEPLLAYLYVRAGTPAQVRELLARHARHYADREGYDLADIVVGFESAADPAAGGGMVGVHALADRVQALGVGTVLVVGPARHVLVMLPRLCGVTVITLAQVRRFDDAIRGGAERPRGAATPDRRRSATGLRRNSRLGRWST